MDKKALILWVLCFIDDWLSYNFCFQLLEEYILIFLWKSGRPIRLSHGEFNVITYIFSIHTCFLLLLFLTITSHISIKSNQFWYWKAISLSDNCNLWNVRLVSFEELPRHKGGYTAGVLLSKKARKSMFRAVQPVKKFSTVVQEGHCIFSLKLFFDLSEDCLIMQLNGEEGGRLGQKRT